MRPESDLTAPSSWCPQPERWHAEDEQSAEVEVSELVAAFVRALQPDYVVETGTAHGFTAAAIGRALRANGHGHLDTLEVDPALVAEAQGRCAGLPITVIEQSSMDFTPARRVGFAWFDSLLNLRIPEFERYRPYMTAGTIVGFHDVAPHFGAFGQVLANHRGLWPIFLRTPRGVCFAEVTG